MKKKLFRLALLTALACALLIVGASAASEPTQPAGSGTVTDPYQISTAQELYWFAQEVNNGDNDANAKLTADITINENVLDEDGGLNGGTNLRELTPIGSSSKRYTGTFDGQGHTISGLYVDIKSTSNS